MFTQVQVRILAGAESHLSVFRNSHKARPQTQASVPDMKAVPDMNSVGVPLIRNSKKPTSTFEGMIMVLKRATCCFRMVRATIWKMKIKLEKKNIESIVVNVRTNDCFEVVGDPPNH
jgi:hypothetical protein